VRLIVLLCTFLISYSVFSYEVKGILKNLDHSNTILEGESFNAQINIWPMADENLNNVKDVLIGKTFLDHFYIASVSNIKFSENNSDVIIVYAKLVLTTAYQNKSVFIWTYKSLTIPFEIENINPVKNDLEKDFIILSQESGGDKLKRMWPYTVIALVVIIVITPLAIRYRKLRVLKMEKQRVLLLWRERFKNAQTRTDIENIYKTRDEWLKLIGGETPPILEFFQKLDLIQYKKEWSDIEEHQVMEAYDDIRGIF